MPVRIPAPVFLGIAVVLPITAPGGVSPDEASSHWAFQSPAQPTLPGKGHPIDELLAIRQGEKNLAPVPEASREVLLRRAWHVITGLQPDPDLRARALAQDFGAPPILLRDEVAAHLDADRRAALYAEICALGAQAWMTGTGPELFEALGDRVNFIEVSEQNGISNLEEL